MSMAGMIRLTVREDIASVTMDWPGVNAQNSEFLQRTIGIHRAR
jgi:enoyl-CoA hydratase/carnithine racemase